MLREERMKLQGAAKRTGEQDTLLESLERRVAALEAVANRGGKPEGTKPATKAAKKEAN